MKLSLIKALKKSVLPALMGVMLISGVALAAGDAKEPPKQDWSHKGMVGTFDKAALQRGFQVYKQVCASCHSMNLLSYRNLADLGYTDAEIRTIAAEYTVTDGPNDEGEMFERPALPSDRFVKPYANDKAARYANGGAFPVDLSLVVRARHYNEDYIYALLTGYKEAPEGFALSEGMAYNEYFPGQQIAMPAPISEGVVAYDDGTEATVEQMAKDVTTFLTWSSYPNLEASKRMGLKVLIFLVVFAGVMYLTKKKVWKDLED